MDDRQPSLGLSSGITPEPGDDDQTHSHDQTAATPRRSYLPATNLEYEQKPSNQGLDRPHSFMDDAEVCDIVATHPSWAHCPAHVRTSMSRLMLLTDATPRSDWHEAHDKAVFGLLREIRTRSLVPSERTEQRLIDIGRTSDHWLVRQEADLLSGITGDGTGGIRGARESFRRLRDSHAVQIALDVRDLDQALEIACAAAVAGADLIEVGDPLIKAVGVTAIEWVKRAVPQTTVVAEMMSSDWGRDQIILAAEAGADVALLIGPASAASVSAAVEAGGRFGVPVVLDVPAGRLDRTWVSAMERVGVDGFTITTNIDNGVAGSHPLEQARILRSWTRLPVAVSGGFGHADDLSSVGDSWDILIVGRSVTDAVDPALAVRSLLDQISGPSQGRR
jgi:3-keto-L-gulonate-6-phosphate decarboxylase